MFGGGGPSGAARAQRVDDIVGRLDPEMGGLGVATADEIGYDTLSEGLRDEAGANGSVIVGHLQIGCWSRV